MSLDMTGVEPALGRLATPLGLSPLEVARGKIGCVWTSDSLSTRLRGERVRVRGAIHVAAIVGTGHARGQR